jgi:microcystin-dependent protein
MDPYIGEVRLFAGNFAPSGWALCWGQLISISQNTALFSILGTFYGGNGTTTFALPDLRGRMPLGQGQGPGLANMVIGEAAGTETANMLLSNMPGHTHFVNVNGDTNGMSQTVTNTYLNGKTASGEPVVSGVSALTTLSPATVGVTGGNQPFGILPPFTCLNYIIALQGVFPSRN